MDFKGFCHNLIITKRNIIKNKRQSKDGNNFIYLHNLKHHYNCCLFVKPTLKRLLNNNLDICSTEISGSYS